MIKIGSVEIVVRKKSGKLRKYVFASDTIYDELAETSDEMCNSVMSSRVRHWIDKPSSLLWDLTKSKWRIVKWNKVVSVQLASITTPHTHTK